MIMLPLFIRATVHTDKQHGPNEQHSNAGNKPRDNAYDVSVAGAAPRVRPQTQCEAQTPSLCSAEIRRA
jgi:hypothetical protein